MRVIKHSANMLHSRGRKDFDPALFSRKDIFCTDGVKSILIQAREGSRVVGLSFSHN